MADREYKTRRGALLDALSWDKVGPGRYLFEGGYSLTRNEGSAVAGGRWAVMRPGSRPKPDPLAWAGARYFDTMTDALEYIADKLDDARDRADRA